MQAVGAPVFIQANTRLLSPPLVPEIKCWLADELTPLWQATETWLDLQNCQPPYWAFAWPGGQALARYCLDNPKLLTGRCVFDLAAGCGIAAIAAYKAGATVQANEIDLLALSAITLNAVANNVVVEPVAGNRVGDPLTGIDIVLAGDICYERTMTETLLRWLHSLAVAGKEVWLADPGRTYLPRDGLVELATYDVQVNHDVESTDRHKTILYRLIP